MDDNKTINLSLPKSLLDAIDKQAEVEFRNRSDLIREAARKYISQRGGMSVANKLTKAEEARIHEALNFSDFASKPAIIISCTYRPQPNTVKDIFKAGSDVMNLIEQPPKLRNMGWALDTLDRAKPVAGEFLEVANGKRKLLRLYRDGQHVFSAGMHFFGHAVNKDENESSKFNLLAVAEFITNFTNFSSQIAQSLNNGINTYIFTIVVSNPAANNKSVNSLGLTAYDGFGMENTSGTLNLDWAERNIVIVKDDNLTIEKIAGQIYSEFCYFFGARSDEIWYINKETMEMNTDYFKKIGN